VLLKQEYIGKHYSNSYRLRGRPAEYYLHNRGIRYLKDNLDMPTGFLRNLYKDKRAKEPFIDKCLLQAKLYMLLKQQYPNKYSMYTKTELLNHDYFVRPLPDMYLKAKIADLKSFIVDIFDPGTPRFLMVRRLRTHQEQDGYEWDNTEHGRYPDVLLVAPHERAEQKLIDLIEGMMDDFDLYTTTIDLLFNPEGDKAIWRSAYGDEDNSKRLPLNKLQAVE
jgi:hypothetical protein